MESKEMRRLTARWASSTGWPKRLEWVEIDGLRGWTNTRFDLKYPIMALVGENGSGKSTVLQSIAAIYKSKPPRQIARRRQPKKPIYAGDFFPETIWDHITRDAAIRYSIRQGNIPPIEGSLRKKPQKRWRGYKDRPERQVVFIDLSRIQPISARTGYSRLADPRLKEKSFDNFDQKSFTRLKQIIGKEYQVVGMSYTDLDESRPVPVFGHSGNRYSGFQAGAGETVLAELLQLEIPPYSIVLIDEIESSLHPRLQRRLIRDLAELARNLELQIVVSTHSSVILDELPAEARAHIMQIEGSRKIVYGVTPEFAMTKMDEVAQHECDLYVEDERAERMLLEIIVAHASNRDCALRCRTIRYGASSVGKNLGIMVFQNKFHRPSFVFLDGDEVTSAECMNLPGQDPPERVVFEALKARNWENLKDRIKRGFADVADACTQAMSLPDCHEWVTYSANKLVISGDALWHAMCSEWASHCLTGDEARKIVQPIEDALDKVLRTFTAPAPMVSVTLREETPALRKAPATTSSSDSLLPFEQSQNGGED